MTSTRSWHLALAASALLSVLGCASSSAATHAPAIHELGAALETGDATLFDASSDDDASMGARALLSTPLDAHNQLALTVLDGPPARDAKGKANEAAKNNKQADAEDGEPEEAIAKDDQTPNHGREIVYTAGQTVSVYDLGEAMSAVESMPDIYGGWVHSRSRDQVVLRLPGAQLKPAMAAIAKLGNVESRTLQAQDVTAEYVDLESRIKVLRETQAQLLELLAKAKTVEEALHVRSALDNTTMELEVALGRMRQLSDLIGFSTLSVYLIERGPQDIPSSNDPFAWVDSLGVEATEWR